MDGRGVGFTRINDVDDGAMSELAGAGGRRTAGASFHDRKNEGDAARRAPTCALVIFGASGDLTERKLPPAIPPLPAHHPPRPEFAPVGGAPTPNTHEE